ncbi:hypothetical protein M758_8G088900, partial [Ceratodon purpureus]
SLKPTCAFEWRREFGVGEITEASVSKVASIGEAYVHSYLAKDGRPVIIVISSKQFPNIGEGVPGEGGADSLAQNCSPALFIILSAGFGVVQLCDQGGSPCDHLSPEDMVVTGN